MMSNLRIGKKITLLIIGIISIDINAEIKCYKSTYIPLVYTLDRMNHTKQLQWLEAILICISILTILAVLNRNRKLKKSIIEIKQIQQTREKFYSILSHDLRSPIESYQGLANSISYLIKQGKYEQIHQIADQIDSTGMRLQNLINNLLEWSMEQQHFISVQKTQIEVSHLIASIIEIYTTAIVKRQLILENKIESGLTLCTDKNLFHTILRNAIDNSIKSSPQNTIVTIESKKISNHIEISIANKAFLSEEQIKNISELFTTKNNWQPSEKGYGLGLILMKQFAEKLGVGVQFTCEDNIAILCFTFST